MIKIHPFSLMQLFIKIFIVFLLALVPPDEITVHSAPCCARLQIYLSFSSCKKKNWSFIQLTVYKDCFSIYSLKWNFYMSNFHRLTIKDYLKTFQVKLLIYFNATL